MCSPAWTLDQNCIPRSRPTSPSFPERVHATRKETIPTVAARVFRLSTALIPETLARIGVAAATRAVATMMKSQGRRGESQDIEGRGED